MNSQCVTSTESEGMRLNQKAEVCRTAVGLRCIQEVDQIVEFVIDSRGKQNEYQHWTTTCWRGGATLSSRGCKKLWAKKIPRVESYFIQSLDNENWAVN